MSVIKVEDIAHVRFSAPDADAMKAFLVDFGLTTCTENGALYARGTGPAPFVHATTVGEPGFRKTRYRGEQKFPLIFQNIHRYFFYIAVIFIGLLSRAASVIRDAREVDLWVMDPAVETIDTTSAPCPAASSLSATSSASDTSDPVATSTTLRAATASPLDRPTCRQGPPSSRRAGTIETAEAAAARDARKAQTAARRSLIGAR